MEPPARAMMFRIIELPPHVKKKAHTCMKDTPFTIAYRYISKANEALPLSRKSDTAQLSFPPHHVPLPEGNSKLC